MRRTINSGFVSLDRTKDIWRLRSALLSESAKVVTPYRGEELYHLSVWHKTSWRSPVGCNAAPYLAMIPITGPRVQTSDKFARILRPFKTHSQITVGSRQNAIFFALGKLSQTPGIAWGWHVGALRGEPVTFPMVLRMPPRRGRNKSALRNDCIPSSPSSEKSFTALRSGALSKNFANRVLAHCG